MDFINAVSNDCDTWMVVNVPNQGTLSFLPEDSFIETGCLVNKAGIRPLIVSQVPNFAWDLIAAVKNYEQLAVEAAVEADRRKAKPAMLAHPLIREHAIVDPLLDVLLEDNREHLPLFFS